MRYLFPLSPYNQQRQFEKPVWVYPAHLAMYATYLRDQGHEVFWGNDPLKDDLYNHYVMKTKPKGPWPYDVKVEDDTQIDIPFEDLPMPDRKFTDAMNPRWQSYGNYKFHPATHMMASNLCWYGKCTFCVDTKKLKTEKRGLRSVDDVIAEIDMLISQGYKEVFDDSGTFPIGKWLTEFCEKMQLKDRNKKIKIGCNLKPLEKIDYEMMAKAGFRFILVGIESANQETIDKIKKGQKASKVIQILKAMSEAGLEPHGTFMTGYPWETKEDETKTIRLCHYLLKRGYLKTAQASVYSPPRTKPSTDSVGHKYLPMFYDVYRSPTFWMRKIKDIHCWEDFTYLLRGVRLVIEEKWRKLWLRR
jgi:radical SAM superfamily enzyme YgiQ (UPF0313 family)